MNRRFLFALLTLMLPAAIANAGDLLILSDTASTDSTLTDGAPRVVTLYAVHTQHSGASGVHFAVVGTSGFTGVWLSETTSYLSFGTSTTGIAIAYGACLLDPVLVLTMNYQLFGTSAACSELRIVAAPGKAAPLCLEDGGCFSETPCRVGALHVNCTVATEHTTWGRVKALYR
jgi:hypothetical protein